MLYELRSYEVVPGRMPALNARFQNHTLGFFAKHGIRAVGFWEAAIGTSNVLHYLLAWDTLAHREKAWGAFMADPEWQRVRDETQRDGPIVAHVRNEIWQPTAYSAMK
jgi:hypothetical protein